MGHEPVEFILRKTLQKTQIAGVGRHKVHVLVAEGALLFITGSLRERDVLRPLAINSE